MKKTTPLIFLILLAVGFYLGIRFTHSDPEARFETNDGGYYILNFDDNEENKGKKGIDPAMINTFMIALYLVAVAFLGYIVWMLGKKRKKK